MVPPDPVHHYELELVGAKKHTKFAAAVCRSQGSDYVFFDRDGNEVNRVPKASVQNMKVV
jgi:hypothetical protein